MKKLLIIDIDETILHSTFEEFNNAPDFHYKSLKIYLRPGLSEFFNFCFKNYDVAIWTSAKADYAKFVLKKVIGDLSIFKFIWTRSKCETNYASNGFYDESRYVKNLKNISGYSLKSIIMIDDTPQNIIPIENVIPIPEYRGNKMDNELVNIIKKELYIHSCEAKSPKHSKQNP